MRKMRNACDILIEMRFKGRDRPLGKTRRRWQDTVKIILKRLDVRVWTKFIWLRTGSSCGLL
jgi:hypothetical protein